MSTTTATTATTTTPVVPASTVTGTAAPSMSPMRRGPMMLLFIFIIAFIIGYYLGTHGYTLQGKTEPAYY